MCRATVDQARHRGSIRKDLERHAGAEVLERFAAGGGWCVIAVGESLGVAGDSAARIGEGLELVGRARGDEHEAIVTQSEPLRAAGRFGAERGGRGRLDDEQAGSDMRKLMGQLGLKGGRSLNQLGVPAGLRGGAGADVENADDANQGDDHDRHGDEEFDGGKGARAAPVRKRRATLLPTWLFDNYKRQSRPIDFPALPDGRGSDSSSGHSVILQSRAGESLPATPDSTVGGMSQTSNAEP